MNTLYYTIFGLLSLLVTSHQVEPDLSQLDESFCGHGHAQQLLQEQHPALAEQTEELEEDAYRFFDTEFVGGLRDLEILPVVFHLIHNNGSENISDALVLQGLADLNAAFANEGYYDQGTGANTELQFCLAERDPSGNATTGINRVVSTFTNMTLETDDLSVKDLIRWNPEEYINIWLVAEVCSDFQGCDINGYAYFPSAHGTPEDGIVLESQWVGSSPANSSLLVHQMGHYLGLFHTFENGCTNDDCLANGDRVCDTPPDQSTVLSACDDAPNTCTTDVNAGDPNNPFATDQNDMINNYMDFSDPNCYNAFTQGQADRMHFFAEGARSSLLDSEACLPPCTNPITADFTTSATIINAGETLNFNNTSTNATTANWLIDGVPFSTNTDASYTFNNLGSFSITLEVGNADPNCSDEFTLDIEVICGVQAVFTASAETVEVDDPVSFSNSSTGATAYSWLIDGTAQSENLNYNNTFTTAGLYDVCLIASNNFCADTSCITITVTDFAGDCNATFIKAYGNDILDENAYAIAQSNDGNFYVGGSREDSVLILKIDDTGNLLWQKSFLFSTNGNNILGDLIVDSEGYIVGCGMGNTNANDRDGFVFRYDPDTDLIDWVQNHDHPTLNVNNLSISEMSTGGDFLVAGQSNNNAAPGLGCDGYLFRINRLTGAMAALNNNYNLGSCETFQTAQIYNGSLYVGGRYNFAGGGSNRMRSATTRMDLNGNEIWTRLYLVDVAANAHLYLVDLLVEDDFIIQAHHGDIDGTAINNDEVYLTKTNLDGQIDWAMSYSLSASNDNIVLLEIVSTPDGYALLGLNTSDNQIFVLKTDKDGNEQWARSYGGSMEILAGFSDNIRYSGIEMIYADDYFYLAAHSDEVSGSDDDIIILKIDNNGLINSSCDFIQTLEVNATEFLNPYDGLHPLTSYITDIGGTISNNSPTTTFIEEEILCIAGCIEICDNGIDDDQDGLIDCYDPDCCATPGCEAFYYTGCPEGCVYTFDDAPISAEVEWVSNGPGDWCSYNTPITGDIDGDGIPEVIGKPCTGEMAPATEAYPNLLIVDGATGFIEDEIVTPAFYYLADGPAIADVDNNGFAEIFIMASDHPDNNNFTGGGAIISGNVARRVLCYEYNGTTYVEKWMSDEQAGYDDLQQAISVSVTDFNGDGIPELYVGTQIFNSLTGEFIVEGGAGSHHGAKPIGDNASLSQSLTVAADVLPDSECVNCSGLELVAGGMVFSVEINPANPAASTMNVVKTLPYSLPSGSYPYDKDGFTSLADIDKDGDLDAVVTTTNENFGIVYAWDLQTIDLLYTPFQTPSSTNEGFISQANIADFDGDGFPEIGVCTQNEYRVLKPTGNPVGGTLDVVWTLNTDDNSGSTGSAVFDFNNDGAQEVVYRGETELRILDGSTGTTLTALPCVSGTRIEYPVIVDVDEDGETEILCSCANTLTAYGSAFIPWLNARSVWNQHTYMNVNINDDLTVPTNQQGQHIVGDSVELNNFLTMYADQDFIVADAEISVDSAYCNDNFELVVHYEICNVGANDLTEETPIGFYQGNPTVDPSASLDSVSLLGQTLQSGDCIEIVLTIPSSNNAYTYLVVNDNGTENPPFDLAVDFPVNFIPECDYTNNIAGYDLLAPFQPLDLGPNVETCENGIVVLDAGAGFDSYSWSTLSTEQTISVSSTGWYYVTTMIGCAMQSDSVLVTVDPQTILSLGPDIITCSGEEITVSVEPDNFDNYVWSSDAILDCYDCPSATFTPNDGETEIIVTGSSVNGCISTDTIMITAGFAFIEDSIDLCFGKDTIISGITISGTNVFRDTIFTSTGCDTIITITSLEREELFLSIDSETTCPEDEDGTTMAIATGGLAPYDYTWNPALTNSPNQFGLPAGSYSLTVTDANGCTISESVEVAAKPGVDFLYETMSTTCYDSEDGVLRIDSMTTDLLFSLEGLNFTNTLVFDNLPCGQHLLQVLDTLSCIHTEPFFIDCPPEVIVLLPADTIIDLGESLLISSATNIQDSVVYEWFPPTFLDCIDCPRVTTFPFETIDYSLMVTDTTGCTDTDSMRVTVRLDRRVYIPNAFSPNGDGINDVVYIFGDFAVAEILDFQIFNRWGAQVFALQNFPPNDRQYGWDGNFNGKPMNSGVFTYFARVRFIDGEELLYSGDITIIK